MITPKTMGQTKTMGQLEAENADGFRNPTRTEAEQAEIDRRTKAMREHDLKHTATESEEPEDDDYDLGDYHPYGDPQV